MGCPSRGIQRLSKYLARELRSETYERLRARKSLFPVGGAGYFDGLFILRGTIAARG